MSKDENADAQRELLEGVLKRVRESWYKPESDAERDFREAKERRQQAVYRSMRIRQSKLRRDILRLEEGLRAERERDGADRRAFLRVACFLDHALDADKADEVIGDLFEQYVRRVQAGAWYIRSWLWFQAGWIVLDRGIDLLGRVRKAWAGK